MKPIRIPLCFLALALVCGGAFAQEPVMVNTNAKKIVAEQQAIQQELGEKRGRFQAIKPAQREQLTSKQDTVLRMLDGKSLTTELSSADQLRLLNELEAISAILNDAEGQRLVCERQKTVGSNRPKNVCMTVAERRQMQDSAQRDLRNRDQRCTDGWGSGFCKN